MEELLKLTFYDVRWIQMGWVGGGVAYVDLL